MCCFFRTSAAVCKSHMIMRLITNPTFLWRPIPRHLSLASRKVHQTTNANIVIPFLFSISSNRQCQPNIFPVARVTNSSSEGACKIQIHVKGRALTKLPIISRWTNRKHCWKRSVALLVRTQTGPELVELMETYPSVQARSTATRTDKQQLPRLHQARHHPHVRGPPAGIVHQRHQFLTCPYHQGRLRPVVEPGTAVLATTTNITTVPRTVQYVNLPIATKASS